jgi:citrate synthase
MSVEQSVAASRLAILSRQLAGQRLDEPGCSLSRNPTDGDDESRPAPGGGRGTLTVVDNRTGKKYTVSMFSASTCCLPPPIPPSPLSPLTVPSHVVHVWPAQLEISDGGTLNAQALKQIKAGGDGVGLRTYDPG